MSEEYSILLTVNPRVEVRGVSRPLAKLFGCPLTDVTIPLRQAWGIVYEQGLPLPLARSVLEILEASGQRGLLLRSADLVPRLRVRHISWAELTEPALVIGAAYEKDRIPIPWSKLLFVSLGVIRLEAADHDFTRSKNFREMVKLENPEDRKMLRDTVAKQVLNPTDSDSYISTRPVKAADEAEAREIAENLPVEYHLDLVLADPWIQLRISHADFCYAAMAEVGAKTAFGNFRALVDRMHALAPDCPATEITQQFLAGRVREADLFDDIHQFEDYTRWQANRLIAQAADQQSNTPGDAPDPEPVEAEVDP